MNDVRDIWSIFNSKEEKKPSVDSNGNRRVVVFRKRIGKRWKANEDKKYFLMFVGQNAIECDNWIMDDINSQDLRHPELLTGRGISRSEGDENTSLTRLGTADFGIEYLVEPAYISGPSGPVTPDMF